mmetsp:Transcript_1895/g.2911  ORF Transcript_1895/g.2911 Transcript_1895/m.2911 type:complete len:134 (+) Transcript_1895:95-496(+)
MFLKLLVLFAAFCPINGYAMLGRKHRYLGKQNSVDGSSFMLKYRASQEEHGTYVLDMAALNVLNKELQPPITAFLPRLSQEPQELMKQEKMEQLLDMEIIAGRLAMTAAVILLCNEISNGKSIPAQILELFNP